MGEILARDEGALTVPDDAPLETVLGNDALRRLGALVAIDGEGRLSGVITVDAVGRALRPPRRPPPDFGRLAAQVLGIGSAEHA